MPRKHSRYPSRWSKRTVKHLENQELPEAIGTALTEVWQKQLPAYRNPSLIDRAFKLSINPEHDRVMNLIAALMLEGE